MDMKTIFTFLQWTALPSPCSSQFKINFFLKTEGKSIPYTSKLLVSAPSLWAHLALQLLPSVIPLVWQELKASLTQSPLDFYW